MFVLLPLALVARMLMGALWESPSAVSGGMRLSIGFGKWVLLVSPLGHLAEMVAAAASDSLSCGVVWLGLLARLLCLHFAVTGFADVLCGIRDLFGSKGSDAACRLPFLRDLTERKMLHWVAVLLLLALGGQLIQAGGIGFWQQTKALFMSAPRTAASAFLEAWVWTDFHVLTLVAALASFAALPPARLLVRTPTVWKAVGCLLLWLFAAAMFWTHAAPR